MTDVTLACKDVNPKFDEIVTVVDVDDEDCVGNNSTLGSVLPLAMFLYFAEATILSLCCKDKHFSRVLQRQLIFIRSNCFLTDPSSINGYPCH